MSKLVFACVKCSFFALLLIYCGIFPTLNLVPNLDANLAMGKLKLSSCYTNLLPQNEIVQGGDHKPWHK